MLVGKPPEFVETPDDGVLAVSPDGGRRGDEGLPGRWLEEVAGIRVVERNLLLLERESGRDGVHEGVGKELGKWAGAEAPARV